MEKEENNNPHPPAYVNCNGLRYAIPYDSTTNPIFVKDKFVGQTLDLVLGQMFRRSRGAQPLEEAAAHWLNEIKAKRVEIRHKKTCKEDPWEWKVASQTVVVCRGDSIRLQQHVHEKAVPAVSKIDVLFENEKWIAISKPGGIATLDEYGKGVNSLLTLVEEEIISRQSSNNATSSSSGDNGNDNKNNNKKNNKKKNKLNVQLAHRLDKPVSGVLLLGKSPGKAASLLREIQTATKGEAGGAQKVYVARVWKNPDSIALVNAPEIHHIDHEDTFPDEITVEIELGWDNDNKRAVAMRSNTEAFAERVLSRTQSQEGQDRKEERKNKKLHKLLHRDKDGSGGNKVNGCKEEGKDDDSSPPVKKRKSTTSTATSATKVHTTRFKRLSETKQADETFLVECRPLSGQRHQIRAHLAAIGWPIANDTLYIGNSKKVCKGTTKLWAYVDDEIGTLKRVLGSPSIVRPWCTKCNWTMRMLSASSTENKEDNKQKEAEEQNGKANELRQLEVEGEIWLHSMRYVLPKAGLDVTAPLPEWARPLSSI